MPSAESKVKRALASGAELTPGQGSSRVVTLGSGRSAIRLVTSDNRLTKAGQVYKSVTGQELSAWRPGIAAEGILGLRW